MKCPNCGSEVVFHSPRCPSCGVVYLDRLLQKAWDAQVSAARPRQRRRRSSWTGGVLLAVGGILAAFGFWHFGLRAPGNGLPAGAIVHPQGFAFVVPQGWSCDLSERPRAAAQQSARLSDGLAAIEVLTISSELGGASRRSDVRLRALVESQYDGVAARVVSVTALRVDGLEALRVIVTGGRAVMASSNKGRSLSPLNQPAPAFESLPFRGLLVLVPGGGKDFLVKAYADEGYFQEQGWRIEAFLASFRVTRRPTFL